MPKSKLSEYFFDSAWTLSLLGIWPRFIEPNRLQVVRHTLKIRNLPKNLTLLQISDLHLNPRISDHFLNKIHKTIDNLKPDLIVYTGDLLCCSEIGDTTRLKKFLNSISAPYGCFAVLGNHDYASYISINHAGDYDTRNTLSKTGRLLKQIKLTGKTTERAFKPPLHPELTELLKGTPFKLLHNETVRVAVGLSICGLGEHMAGHCEPEKAFTPSDEPVIVLVHNPDAIPSLKAYPGNLILCGHTHGAQINLPILRNRLTPMENPQYKRGLQWENGKWIYTNRGLSGVSPVRLFSPPEIAFFTLERESEI